MTKTPFSADLATRICSFILGHNQRISVFAVFFLLATVAPRAIGSAQQAAQPAVPPTDVPRAEPMPAAPAAPDTPSSLEMPPAAETPPSLELPSSSEAPATPEVGLMPPGQRLEISQDLGGVESRLMQLEERRKDEGQIAGPVAMMSVGYGLGLVSTAVAIASFAAAREANDWDQGEQYHNRLDVNDDGIIDHYDENAYRRIARSFAVVSGIGAAIGIVGSVLLSRRLKERARLEPERRSLERRRRDLRRELEYGTSVTSRSLQISLSGRF